jgi:arabinofuranan 3-O-arabinosyltransferase
VPVARFGPEVGPNAIKDVVADDDLRPKMPAVQIFAVESMVSFPGTRPATVPLASMPRVAGGPEALATLQNDAALAGEPPLGPALLDSDARRAGLPAAPLIVTDTPTDREVDFGRVDNHSSAIRTPDDPRLTQNAVPDYPVPGQPLVQGEWLLDGQPGQLTVTASGSASDATQLGQSAPGSSPAAAFDGNPDTAWVSRGLDSAVGQWLQLDFSRPRERLALDITVGQALGPDVDTLLITTEAGSTVATGVKAGTPATVVPPSGPTRWVQVRAIATQDNTGGNQFAISELTLRDAAAARDLPIRHRVVLPQMTAGQQVSQWVLGPELPGRAACVPDRDTTRCSGALGLIAEEPGMFGRVLSVPTPTSVTPSVTVTAQPSDALNALLSGPGTITASAESAVSDPRGNAGAAVDGDPATTWIAQDNSPTAERPALRLSLPSEREVTGLRVTVPPNQFPARPQRLAIDLGNGRQIRDIPDDGVIQLDPHTTSTISVTVLEKDEVLDVNSLGFAEVAPTGISEIAVLGDDTSDLAADRPIDVSCADGPGITIAGVAQRFSISTTADQLRSGAPIRATACAFAPIDLPAGEQEVVVNPGGAFSVAGVSLTADDAPRAVPAPVDVRSWGSADRSVDVQASDEQRVLVVPESTNTGWHAHAGTQQLTPIVVNGWQQGWIIPAGYAGAIDLTFPLDRPYRWAIGVGLGLVAVLFVLTLWPRRRTRSVLLPVARPIRATVAGPLALAAAVYLLTGPAGLAVAAAVAAIGTATPILVPGFRRRSTAAAWVAGLMMLATIGLAAGPWRSAFGYNGWDWWVQLPAALALVVLAWQAIAVPRWLVRLELRRRRRG